MKLFTAPWSLAMRLTILFALAFFFLFAAGAAVLDWFLVNDMEKDNSQFLAGEMQSMGILLSQKPHDVGGWQDEIDRDTLSSSAGSARYYIRVLDDEDNTIVETHGMTSIISPGQFPKAQQSRAKKLAWATVKGIDGRSFAAAAQWVRPGKAYLGKYMVQMALDRTHEEETIADFRKKALILLVAGALCSASLGFFITKTGLRPLSRLTRVFTRITSEHLNERVESANQPREVAQLANAFDSMLQRLGHSFALQSQFSADLAHELRTPISNLRGEAEVALGKERSADEYRRVIESSIEEYERLSRVIDNLLFLARTEARSVVARLSPINVHQEIDALLSFFEPLAEEKKIEVTLTGNTLLEADGVLFRRAVTNLLSNSFRYTPVGGRISVTVSKEGEMTQVAVADTGIGIDAGSLERVMDRFFRTEQARTMSGHGNGLGLAIVKSIMDLHSGTIGIESTPGTGTVVRLRFPGL